MLDASFRDWRRSYRAQSKRLDGETSFQVVVEESDLWITACCDMSELAAKELCRQRSLLKAHNALQPSFLHSFSPISVSNGAPEIARDMAAAAADCGVGPMAAVAGAVAQRIALALQLHSPDVLVENGGDLFLCSTRERTVGLLPDPEAGVTLGLRLATSQFPLAVCASSARIGHSVSLGRGDLAVVLSSNGAFADAAATALCNMLHERKDLDAMLRKAREWSTLSPGLRGVFAQCGGAMAAWGEVELTAV